MKKLSGGSSGEVSDFFAVILFLAVSVFIIFTLKQNNELKSFRRTEVPPIVISAKPEVPAQKQKSVGDQKPDTDKYVKQLEKELEIARIKITLLEHSKSSAATLQKNEQLVKEKASSEKSENGLRNPKDTITAAELLSEKETLLKEKEKRLQEKEILLEKKEKELMRKEEELNLQK